jgi:hypothetical protein
VLLATTASDQTGYSDASVAGSTTYHYKVRAVDAASNVSGASNVASVTTPAATLTLSPDADARVQEGSPGANYGISYLRADGASDPDVESYLRFSVSGVQGAVNSAKLRLYAYADTADGPAVYGAGGSWSETGITWGNRPARTSGATGDKGPIAANSWAEYDVKQLITGNGSYSFVLATSSSDGVDFRSREYSDATRRPQLMLSVGGSGSGSSGGGGGAAGNPAIVTTPLLSGPPVPPIPGGADRLPPRLTLRGPATQRLKRRHLSVFARCDEACAVTGSASVSVRQASSVLRTRKVTRALVAGASAELELEFSKKAARAIRRALVRKRLSAAVKVVSRDSAGNLSVARRKIRLKR